MRGGRYSSELGIDLGGGDDEIERWFLAATLFGTRISASVAERTFRILVEAGLDRIAQARNMSWDELVALLDRGGYVRYDFRTATRLRELCDQVSATYQGKIAEIGRRCPVYPDLRKALDELNGWGPVTVQLFLREMRGVWPGAAPPLDERAARAAGHLRLLPDPPDLAGLDTLAEAAGLDTRDLESGLVRLDLAHRRQLERCPGGPACTAV